MPGTIEDREWELHRKIAEAHSRHRAAFEQEIAPWVKELSDIELCKPPRPVTLADGRVMTYVGPLGTWTPDGVKP